ATAHVRGLSWPGWEDSAVPPDRIGDYLRDLQKLYEKYGYDASLYGHFGQGCIHTRINFDLETAEGIQRYRAFMNDASDLCVRYGGSLSAEHGDGQARAEMLPKMFGADLVRAFQEFKEIWDPQWKMNPGKVVDPYRIDDNLRLGTDYDPPHVETHFQYPSDDGSFPHALLRCVGVGQCQRKLMTEDDTMCPSFLATHEEMHSTRGRAHLLFEMLNGSETPGPWDNEGVKEALDLCLACKGCKSDCPVHVDMATYKAEFLSHYYEEGHSRPLSAYMMGLIPWWARLASYAPKVANFFTQTPGVSGVMKRATGLAPERTLPPFAEETFKDWFFRRGVRNAGKPRVILWPDTFNNYFRPQTGKAAVDVLEDAGYQVVVPRQHLCCGRPLYDYGWLGLARKLLQDILDSLREEIQAGTPIVGMEPSCVAVFRDELMELFPNDEDAKRLKEQTYILSEFLMKKAEGYEPPKLKRKAVVHGHCHHKSVMDFNQERALLTKMGLDYEVPVSSCCGVAGAFGFEANHYDVSMKCGEYGLLPAVRNAEKDTFIISDGFSCQNQVEHATDRHALHVAEVLQIALRGESDRLGAYPERQYLKEEHAPGFPAARKGRGRKKLAIAACLFVGSAAATWIVNRR
ncbi:MAG TPA: FAD-linked oxidase C-terminal domain-containing protein, partial [Rhodothermales bacterium]|nr:FAD-linked oxidase C-terminal domain-containing protein [Rhodothermales bacterium]